MASLENNFFHEVEKGCLNEVPISTSHRLSFQHKLIHHLENKEDTIVDFAAYGRLDYSRKDYTSKQLAARKFKLSN